MLSVPPGESLPGVTITSLILIIGIIAGAVLGYTLPTAAQWLGAGVDYTLLALVGVLFFGVRFGALFKAFRNLRFLMLALLANFVAVPLIGYGIASLFLSTHPLFMVGLVIYFMSPCTDWFLSFTRLCGGNVALGTALIPINMAAQLLLYPFFLQWFTQNTVQVEAGTVGSILLQWFLLPLIVAVVAHQLLRLVLSPGGFERVLATADGVTPWLTALLVLQIFAGNISVILEHFAVVTWVLLAVFTFFVLTFLLSEGLSRLFQLPYSEYALLTMTIAARNAPLMLAVTMAALPDQPLIYAALVIGMLVEFPHLAGLRRVLLIARKRRSQRMQVTTAKGNS
ncbi:MAG: arsenic resistance protein [Pseudomonadota bacterium]